MIDRRVVTPLDMERNRALTGGNISPGHDVPGPAVLLPPRARRVRLSDAIRGLYLAGSAAHPGGGVIGACGHNAVQQTLRSAGR